MKFLKNTKRLNNYLNQMFESFVEDDCLNESHRKWFIEQTMDYGTNTCQTMNELNSYMDGLLTNVPEPSSEEGLPGAPEPKDWEDLLKALRKTYGTNISWYNDKRKNGRRIKIVGVRDDAFRKQVYNFIHKLGYDVHEHITEHTAYPKTLVVFFKE